VKQNASERVRVFLSSMLDKALMNKGDGGQLLACPCSCVLIWFHFVSPVWIEVGDISGALKEYVSVDKLFNPMR
jgi:hypothetical protein